MTILGRVLCPEPGEEGKCFRVEIENMGSASGEGFCALRRSFMGPNGEDSVFGEHIQVGPLAPGASVRRVARWTNAGEAADSYTWSRDSAGRSFASYCEPGWK